MRYTIQQSIPSRLADSAVLNPVTTLTTINDQFCDGFQFSGGAPVSMNRRIKNVVQQYVFTNNNIQIYGRDLSYGTNCIAAGKKIAAVVALPA